MSKSVWYLPFAGAVAALAVSAALCSCAAIQLDASESEWQTVADLAHLGVPAPDQVASRDSALAAAAEVGLPAEGPIQLADLWSSARRLNPRLAAARSGVGVAAGHALQSSLYPNPTIELSSEEVPFGPGVLNEGSTMVGVTQPIVIGNRLDAARNAARADQAVSEAQIELVERELFGEINVLHSRLITIRETDRLNAELSALAEQTLASAQARFDARAAPQTEVTKAEIEVYQIRLQRSRLAREQEAAGKQLALLVGVAVDVSRLEGSLLATPQALDLARLDARLRDEHPALQVADREIEVAQARLEAIKAERTLDLDLHAGVGYRGESNEAVYELGVGVTLPLWDDRRGDILAGRYALMQARQRRQALEIDLLSALASVHGEYEASRAQLDSVRDQILPAAAHAFEQTTEAYRGGHASFLDVLDAQRTLTEARTTALELSGEVAAARARITQLIDGPETVFAPGNGASLQKESNPIINKPRTGAEDRP